MQNTKAAANTPGLPSRRSATVCALSTAKSPVETHRTIVHFAHMKYDDRPDPAKRLEQARIARGYGDARQAADAFGWNYHTYAQHENGTRGIHRAADRYARAYGVSTGWLLTGEGAGPKGTGTEEAEWQRLLRRAIASFVATSDVPAPSDNDTRKVAQIVSLLVSGVPSADLETVRIFCETITLARRNEQAAVSG